MRNELLAVGANDPYVRIYDRRKIKTQEVVTPVRAKYIIDRMDRRSQVVSQRMSAVACNFKLFSCVY